MALSMTSCDSFTFSKSKGIDVSVSSENEMPVIVHKDNKLYINGEFITETEKLRVNRIDDKIISLTTDSGTINKTADGKEITLADVIIDREFYESKIKGIASLTLLSLSTDFYNKYLDFDAMMEVLGNFEEALKLDFSISNRGIGISYPFLAQFADGSTRDSAFFVTFNYDTYAEMINPDFLPSDGVSASAWVTGNLRIYPSDVDSNVYSKSWTLSSLVLKNYKDENIYWYCIEFEKESEITSDKIYYSVVCTRTDKGVNKILYSKEVEIPFICCDVEELENIIDSVW